MSKQIGRDPEQLALLFILVAAGFGQTSPVPYEPGSGATFTSETVNLSYPGSYPSIRQVDFGNFNFPILDQAGKPAGSFSLKDGHYKHDEPGDRFSMDLDSVCYLSTSTSSKGGFALVLFSWFAAGGSSSQGGTAQVFTVSDTHLRSVQKIGWDTHFQAGQPTDSFDPSTNTLVVRSAHYLPGDAHCCVSAMDIVTFRWDGARFIQFGLRTELSEYGKKEGKILPKALPR
ncbi:MAG: LppP/LprE family lipoprotein [Bryobacteraceae bacterium]